MSFWYVREALCTAGAHFSSDDEHLGLTSAIAPILRWRERAS
jgi:hypothetical protein